MGLGIEILAALLVVAGLWFLEEGRSRLRREADFREDASWTTGTVVGVEEIRRRNRRLFATVFEYTARDGRAHTVTSREPKPRPEHRIGDLVTLAYEPDRPERAVLNNAHGGLDLKGRWVYALGFVCWGVAAAIALFDGWLRK